MKLKTVKGVHLFWNAAGQQIAAGYRGNCEAYGNDTYVGLMWCGTSDEDLSYVCAQADREPSDFLMLTRSELHKETIRVIRDSSMPEWAASYRFE